MVEIVFVLHPRQNAFFGELVQVLRDELSALGVQSSVSVEGFPEPLPGACTRSSRLTSGPP